MASIASLPQIHRYYNAYNTPFQINTTESNKQRFYATPHAKSTFKISSSNRHDETTNERCPPLLSVRIIIFRIGFPAMQMDEAREDLPISVDEMGDTSNED